MLLSSWQSCKAVAVGTASANLRCYPVAIRTVPVRWPVCNNVRPVTQHQLLGWTSGSSTYSYRVALCGTISQQQYSNNYKNGPASSRARTRTGSTCTGSSAAPKRRVPVMVEGHQCHRVGHAHRRLLLGKSFLATSPNGRFAEGAAAIAGKVLSRIEVHGKNLFYFFTGGSSKTSSSSNGAAIAATNKPVLLSPEEQDPLADPEHPEDSEVLAVQQLNDSAPLVQDNNGSSSVLAAQQQQQQQPLLPTTPRRQCKPLSQVPASPVTPVQGLAAELQQGLRWSAEAAVVAAARSAAIGTSSSRAAVGTPVTVAARATVNAAFATTALIPAVPGNAHSQSAPSPAGAATASVLAAVSTGQQENESKAASDGAKDNTVIVHIHFGMSGAFRTASLPGPEPTPTTRLRLVHQPTGLMAHLSAMTVGHGGEELYREKVSKLGPDPLRPDADPERFWQRVQSTKKPIGLLLMDQSAVAGVGNIYRAEILYKSRLHPEQPGHSVTREQFDAVWHHCVELLHRGFNSGSILTVDPEDAKALGKPWTRRYIYNQRQCGRCKGPVKSWDMAGRTVYCCDACQPLSLSNAVTTAVASGAAAASVAATVTATAPAGVSTAAATDQLAGGSKRRNSRKSSTESSTAGAAAANVAASIPAAIAGDSGIIALSPNRLKSMAAARVAKEFVSHCAPDDPFELQPTKMTCMQLRAHLKSLNLDTRGTKPQLTQRMEAAIIWRQTDTGVNSNSAAATAAQAGLAAAARNRQGLARGVNDVLVVADTDDGRSSSVGELDVAEDRLATNLSVPPVRRRRRAPRKTAAGAVTAAAASTQAAASGPTPAAAAHPHDLVDLTEQLDSQPATPAQKRRPDRTTASRRTRSRHTAASGSSAAAGGSDRIDAGVPAADGPAADGFASASVAAAEKAAAGENRAVEHVALVADDWTEALMFGQLDDK